MEADIPTLPMTYDGQMQNAQMVNYQDTAIGRFFIDKRPNGHKSQEEGRPIYEDYIAVSIRQPGERDERIRPANAMDKVRFAQAWAAFEARRQNQHTGTPLEVLFPHKPSIVKMMDHANIFTVEQLAGLNDTQIQNIGLGGREWHEMAKTFLTTAERGKGYHDLQSQLDAKTQENTKLANLVERLEARVSELENNDKPKRGRGRSAQNEDME